MDVDMKHRLPSSLTYVYSNIESIRFVLIRHQFLCFLKHFPKRSLFVISCIKVVSEMSDWNNQYMPFINGMAIPSGTTERVR